MESWASGGVGRSGMCWIGRAGGVDPIGVGCVPNESVSRSVEEMDWSREVASP